MTDSLLIGLTVFVFSLFWITNQHIDNVTGKILKKLKEMEEKDK
jgi:hypothetical protein